jgi:hypothetical protein
MFKNKSTLLFVKKQLPVLCTSKEPKDTLLVAQNLNALLVTKKQPVSFCLDAKPDGKDQVLALWYSGRSCKAQQSSAELSQY